MSCLNCPFCALSFTNPQMCPHCSAVYCKTCIQSYLQNSPFCPTCQNPLFQLVECTRLLNQVSSILSNVPLFPTCTKHKLPLTHFCQTCNSAICTDCGIIESTHRTHSITKNNCQSLMLCKMKAKEQLTKLKDRLLHWEVQRDALKSEVLKAKQVLTQQFNRMMHQLEQQSSNIQNQIQNNIMKCIIAISETMEYEQNIQQKLMTNTKKDITQIMKPLEQINFANSLSIIEQFQPVYSRHSFTFPPCSYQHSLNYNHLSWRLHSAIRDGYFSLFLTLMDTPLQLNNKQYVFEVEIEMINLSSVGSTISKHFLKKYAIGDCYGEEKVVPIDQLQNYLIEGQLIINLGIRSSNYYQESLLLKQIQSKLQRQISLFSRGYLSQNNSSSEQILM